MKRFYAVVIFMVILGSRLNFASAQNVEFPDVNLANKVREALNLPAGATITTAEMATLTRLDAEGANISDLTGLEHATNLQTLWLDNDWLRENQIINLQPLAALTNLQELGLRGNQIINLQPLAALTNLQGLYLSYNQIINLQPLAALTNLQYLWLENNQIINLQPLAALTNLQELRLERNQIINLQPLAALTNLQELRLERNQIINLQPLAALTNLQQLELASNKIINLQPLAALTNLQGLYLSYNQIINLQPLAALTNLQYLWLENNQIINLQPLAALTNLRYLGLSDNPIINLQPLAALTNLQYLWLENNRISDVSPLVSNTGLGDGDNVFLTGNPLNAASLNTYIPTLQGRGVTVEFDAPVAQTVNIPDANLRTKIEQALGKASGATITTAEMATLTRLDAESANISDLTGLEHATNLQTLYLSFNQIINLQPLAALTNLQTLGLGGNQIINLQPLAALTNLQVLGLSYNQIINLQPLAALTNLQSLGLTNNRISDVSPLVSNTGLGDGDDVSLTGNPLNAASLNTYIPTLQGRGVTVEFDAPVAQTVNIPDANLRTKIEQALGKASGATITTAEMATLTRLDAESANISDLTGLEYATNLQNLGLRENQIINLQPLAALTNLQYLYLRENQIINLQPLAALTNLQQLELASNKIINLQPLAALTNLWWLYLWDNQIINLQPLAALTNLQFLNLWNNQIINIQPLAALTNLQYLDLTFNPIINIQPLAALTNLQTLGLQNNQIINIQPLAALTNLQFLNLQINQIINIQPLAALTNLQDLYLRENQIINIQPLAALTNLNLLFLSNNQIINIQPLAALTNLQRLWLPNNQIINLQPLAALTNLHYLGLRENRISDVSPLVSNTGLGDGDNVILTGNPLNAASLNTYIPTLQGRGVTVEFDKTAPTNTTVSVSPASVESPAVGGQLTLSLKIANGAKGAGYQVTVAFDTSALRYVESANGDYLPAGAFAVPAVVSGNTITVAATALAGESNGDGTLATLTFEVIAVKASTVRLTEVVLSDSGGVASRPQVANGEIIEPSHAKGDVNRDGVVNIQDLVLVAQRFGQTGQNDADMNGDGVVNIQDLVLVAGAFGSTGAAPAFHPQVLMPLTADDVQGWLTEAEQMARTTPAHLRGIAVLEQFLSVLTPKETALLPNYPNPFNPETWIPYRLANASDAQISIYDISGVLVHQLDIGHQAAGYYTNRGRAAYWDGRNEFGERVASGLYFYTLTASDFSATRKMLIGK